MKANYTERLNEYDGQIMTINEFTDSVACGGYTDYDGYGYPVKNGMVDRKRNIYPSLVGTGKEMKSWCPKHVDSDLPEDATHIIWFNK